MRQDYLLQHDGSSQVLAVVRAKEEARVARDWKMLYSKMFERKEVEIRKPPKSHLVPASETLYEKIEAVNKETLTKWEEVKMAHLTEVEVDAAKRAANPSNRDQELLVATVATTVEATVTQILERMKAQKKLNV